MSTLCKTRRLSGCIVHNGEQFAARLHNGKLEWSTTATKQQLIDAALEAGAIMADRRRAVKAGIEVLPLHVYCLGVNDGRIPPVS
jgi:hypothetical protein